MMTTEHKGITFEQVVYCVKQPHVGDYAVGLTWTPISDWDSYSLDELPATLDNGADHKRFPAKEWRKAWKYAGQLSEKHGIPVRQ